ncbi:unnamed protein product [Ectocarpus sp. 12 AP-2014]
MRCNMIMRCPAGAPGGWLRLRFLQSMRCFAAGVNGSYQVRGPLAQLRDVVDVNETAWPSFLTSPRTAAVIGAPAMFGQPLAGTDKSPQLLREAGLHQNLAALGWRVEEMGDVDMTGPPGGADPAAAGGDAHHSLAVGAGCRRLSEAVFEKAAEGKFVLTLGGDHSIALGTLAGVLRARPDTRVLWCDAHADINSPKGSPSGNMHGMPLSFVMGLSDPSTVRGLEWLCETDVPVLRPERIAYVGLRDVDVYERKILNHLKQEHGLFASTMQDVDRLGIGRVMELALEALGVTGNGDEEKGAPLHLSFDIDAVDPKVAPATGTVVRGGLNYREAMYVAESCAETGRLGSMDMVEVNADLTEPSAAAETVQLGLVAVASAMGSRIL